jgi:hypothetical protein
VNDGAGWRVRDERSNPNEIQPIRAGIASYEGSECAFVMMSRILSMS